MPSRGRGHASPKRHLLDKPIAIQRDDIDINTYVESIREENVHVPPVHADQFGVPQHPNILPYFPHVENVSFVQNMY